jgi:type IV secretion system protein VirB10
MRIKKYQSSSKSHDIDNTQQTKIENAVPKNFDKLPENAQIVQASQTNTNITNDQQNASDLNNQHADKSKDEIYNSPLCDDCRSNNATHSNQENSTAILQASHEKNSNDNFEELDPAKLQASKASIIKNPEYTISKGNFLSAILETKIDSSLKGMVSAILSNDIYSIDGSILLLEKGSKITGQYTSQIKEGAERLMVIWDRIRTPNGIIIDLNSFGTDSLGGSGLSGNINHQYGKRFGSAILLSIIDDSLAIASRNQGNITNNIQNTQQQSRNIAEQALSNSINIAPILYKNQGEYINIFIARDLDFSGVYKLKIKG